MDGSNPSRCISMEENKKKEEEEMRHNQIVWIIRWDKAIDWPDGAWSNMFAFGGSYEEAEEFAQEMAKKHGLKVEAIV